MDQQERRDQHGSTEKQPDVVSAAPMVLGPQDSTLLVGLRPSPDNPGSGPATWPIPPQGEVGHERLLQAVPRKAPRHGSSCGTATL